MTFSVWDQGILCALAISNSCKGLVPLDELYVDENGHRWDMCKPCVEAEKRVILQSMVE